MRNSIYIAIVIAVLGVPATAWAQKPSAYPAKGQSAQQQGTDDTQCLAWAKQDTGIDPAAASAPVAPTGPQGERVRGAARGAVLGEVISDDAGEGAAIGAVAGGRRARINQAIARSRRRRSNHRHWKRTTAHTVLACKAVGTASIDARH